ncbi:ABC transporter substrate-binding protein, partial [Lactobacillus sp. XV13L]|nr:ABC transporter substrate-binding protein [Lactobacillus sp. XV13L]
MNLGKKLAALIIAASAVVGISACSNKAPSASSNKIPQISQKTTVVFWHGMQGVQKATLQDLVRDV